MFVSNVESSTNIERQEERNPNNMMAEAVSESYKNIEGEVNNSKMKRRTTSLFPNAFYNPPFREHPACDNNRTSWLRALEYQRDDSMSTAAEDGPTLSWCADGGSVCANTKGEADPFLC